MQSIEDIVESSIFRARWLLAPFFIGLLVAIVPLCYKFLKILWELCYKVLYPGYHGVFGANDVIISILTLIDTALIGSLLLIIAFSGYENFVSKLDIGDHEDRPAWMGAVGFSDLKIKVMGAIVAISAVELLKGFINIDGGELNNVHLAWKTGIHIVFVVSGVLFAVTDRLSEHKEGAH
jgi:uncharacterized protein (TIGR00645 family)